jgi:hypothetical protein
MWGNQAPTIHVCQHGPTTTMTYGRFNLVFATSCEPG